MLAESCRAYGRGQVEGNRRPLFDRMSSWTPFVQREADKNEEVKTGKEAGNVRLCDVRRSAFSEHVITVRLFRQRRRF